jgi:hypothetical protein
MIKLDYITPGSSVGQIGIPGNLRDSVVAFYKAMVASGRQIRLDLSFNLCCNASYLGIWQGHVHDHRQPVCRDSGGRDGRHNSQRISLIAHWIGAMANQISGSNKG